MTDAKESQANVETIGDGFSERRLVQGAYGAALLMVLASVVFSIALPEGPAGLVAIGLLQGVTLLAVLRVSGAHPRTRFMLMAVAAVAITFALLMTYIRVPVISPATPLLWGLIVLAAMAAILRRIFQYEAVNVQAVLGLLTFYLLLGLLFGYMFSFVGVRTPFFAGGQSDHSSYVYYSFITLTTTGYGDLVPAEGLPRALGVAEALFGQLYLVSVVAAAVGNMAGRRRDRG